MPKRSAGILMYRRRAPLLEVLLVHPGGPFWAKKDLGAWSIPKGEYAADEDPLSAPANHSPLFHIHEPALKYGVRALAYLAFDYLRRKS